MKRFLANTHTIAIPRDSKDNEPSHLVGNDCNSQSSWHLYLNSFSECKNGYGMMTWHHTMELQIPKSPVLLYNGSTA